MSNLSAQRLASYLAQEKRLAPILTPGSAPVDVGSGVYVVGVCRGMKRTYPVYPSPFSHCMTISALRKPYASGAGVKQRI